MRQFWFILIILMATASLPAQTNEPVRLALISGSDKAAPMVDVLTAQLSGDPRLQLLERDQIAKVYREQGLSAGNTDYLKLGQLLGADGLLLMETVTEGTNEFLNIRLVAVKPGVVLMAEKFAWPTGNLTEWAAGLAEHLGRFFQKLTVLPRDAIPISVVNLRSAVSSAGASETERQLKLLTIQRLTKERQFFVLERQKMQSLSEEKDLNADDSAFWNGSYLLEGVVDQNVYSADTVTINARLTPPRGGTPLLIDVSGSRTNLAEVVNRLAVKVVEALKINSTIKEWNPADEAASYYEEAKWALRWGAMGEAESAIDSAWALGKTDVDCASLRVTVYVTKLSSHLVKYYPSSMMIGDPSKPGSSPTLMRDMIKFELSQHPLGGVYVADREDTHHGLNVAFTFPSALPDPDNIDQAQHILELYTAYSRNYEADGPQAGTPGNGWKNSSWYDLGVGVLTVAAQVLRDFDFAPDSQAPVTEKLASLRAATRAVADWMAQSPSVQGTYFFGDGIVTHEVLGKVMDAQPNLFACEAAWGCFWQDRPEEGIALYRNLLANAVFSYIHTKLWLRTGATPRLAAWTEGDRKRIPELWKNFVGELTSSTNVFSQLEGRALVLADESSLTGVGNALTNLFQTMADHREELVATPAEIMYSEWHVHELISQKGEPWHGIYYAKYLGPLEAMENEYLDQTVSAKKRAEQFSARKQYFKNNAPYNENTFTLLFSQPNYTRAQAAELLPLVTVYESNLLAEAADQSTNAQRLARAHDCWIEMLVANKLRDILNPAPVTAAANPVAGTQTHPGPLIMGGPRRRKPKSFAPPANSNALVVVTHFCAIPLDKLVPLEGAEHIDLVSSSIAIRGHRWLEGKLVVDVSYDLAIDGSVQPPPMTAITNSPGWFRARLNHAAGQAVAVLDPATEQWEVTGCPGGGEATTLWQGQLFNSGGGLLRKYDAASQQWQALDIGDMGSCQLFVVNNRLYGASESMIFEILDGGKQTRLLASTRRQPPVSALDTENLGTPVLFEGPDHSLRVGTRDKIFTWAGDDWQEVCPLPPVSFPLQIFADGVLFRTDGFTKPGSLAFLGTQSSVVEDYLAETRFRRTGFNTANSEVKPNTLWNLPPGLSLATLPAVPRQADLYLLVDHSDKQDVKGDQPNIIIGRKITPRDGYHADLLRFSRGQPVPDEIFLRFDNPAGFPPVTGTDPGAKVWHPDLPPGWLLFTTNYLFCGLEQHNDRPYPDPEDNLIINRRPGVWMLPLKQIDAALATQQQARRADGAQAAEATERTRKKLLAQYDQNHNGILDPDEKEAALVDPEFIASELDKIDANHNGLLDAKETAYFDANQNKVLDPNEQAGIETALHLLAARLMKRFDDTGDGLLDRDEMERLLASLGPPTYASPPAGIVVLNFDKNRDGFIDVQELEQFSRQYTLVKLIVFPKRGAMPFRPPNRDLEKPAAQMLKEMVETYWRDAVAVTNEPAKSP